MRLLRGLAWAALLAATALVATAQQPGALPSPLRVYLFDVDQGDGALIQSPSGQNVVVDAGENSTQIVEYLTALGVTRVDLVIASHNHADHIGGIPAVLQTFRPALYLDNGVAATTLVQQRVFDALTETGTPVLAPTSREISLGTATLRVIPPPGVPAWDQNDNSLGLLLQYGQFRMSFAGDAEQREWAWWNINHPDWLTPVHVHKASHHGSSNGDSTPNLVQLTPGSVVVSVGADNTYGHPTAATLAAYAAAGSTVYRTDLHGTVLIEVGASGVPTIQVERGNEVPTLGATTFTLSGSVRHSSSGVGLTGVTVTVADGPSAGRATTTTSSGSYSLSRLARSGFTARFSKSGYGTVSRGVTLTDNVALSLSLTPTPAPAPSPTPTPTPAPSSSPAPSPSPSPSPTPSPTPSPSPAPRSGFRVGATCRDGTSSTATGSGACSSRGGVSCWRYNDGTCRAQ